MGNMRVAEQVRDALVETPYAVAVEPSIGGVRPDFVVTSPSGREIVLEGQGLGLFPCDDRRAHHEATFFAEQLRRDVIVVVPWTLADFEHSNVLALDRLVPYL